MKWHRQSRDTQRVQDAIVIRGAFHGGCYGFENVIAIVPLDGRMDKPVKRPLLLGLTGTGRLDPTIRMDDKEKRRGGGS